MPLKDEPVKALIIKVIGKSKKGRKKVIALVQKENAQYSKYKIRRVYKQSGFALSKRLKRKRIQNPSNAASVPLQANEEWAIDFMHDTLYNGRRIRSLNIIDPYNRQCKGMFIAYSIPAIRVIDYLTTAIEIYGKPKAIRCDNGPEFISKQFQLWLENNDINWSKIPKASPQQNCHIERFNRTAREELFDANMFTSLEHALELTHEFMMEYNYRRPHESLNMLTPSEYAA